MSELEHLNVTVSDPDATAKMLHDIFGWRTRWAGESKMGGRSIHVGSADSYVAIYSVGGKSTAPDSYTHVGGLNHIGVTVEDLDAVEERVKAHGFVPTNHGDYEPGRRFYFDDPDGIEWEVVSYD